MFPALGKIESAEASATAEEERDLGSTQDVAETGRDTRIAGVSREEVRKWYALMHLARVLDDKAPELPQAGPRLELPRPVRRA